MDEHALPDDQAHSLVHSVMAESDPMFDDEYDFLSQDEEAGAQLYALSSAPLGGGFAPAFPPELSTGYAAALAEEQAIPLSVMSSQTEVTFPATAEGFGRSMGYHMVRATLPCGDRISISHPAYPAGVAPPEGWTYDYHIECDVTLLSDRQVTEDYKELVTCYGPTHVYRADRVISTRGLVYKKNHVELSALLEDCSQPSIRLTKGDGPFGGQILTPLILNDGREGAQLISYVTPGSGSAEWAMHEYEGDEVLFLQLPDPVPYPRLIPLGRSWKDPPLPRTGTSMVYNLAPMFTGMEEEKAVHQSGRLRVRHTHSQIALKLRRISLPHSKEVYVVWAQILLRAVLFHEGSVHGRPHLHRRGPTRTSERPQRVGISRGHDLSDLSWG
jgi:hypothetical protein